MYKIITFSSLLVMVAGWPQMFATKTFKVGIEYQGSLPMGGGSERYRHRNSLDPFYVTVTANAKLHGSWSRRDCVVARVEAGAVTGNIELPAFLFFLLQLHELTGKNGYVISYLEVQATTDITGEVEFNLVQGQTGSKTMVFQLISNQTDFLKYNYLAFGIREEEYKKLNNIITIQMRNSSARLLFQNCFMILVCMVICLRFILL